MSLFVMRAAHGRCASPSLPTRPSLPSLLPALIASALLAACGSNNNNNQTDTSSAASPATNTSSGTTTPTSGNNPITPDLASDFFQIAHGASQGWPVLAHDPVNPTAPTTVLKVAGSYANSLLLQHQGQDRLSRVITEPRTPWLFYTASNRLWAVDLNRRASQTPIQLTQESQADALCAITGQGRDADRGHYIGYRMPGTDSRCNTADDVFKLVWTTHRASDQPWVMPGLPLTDLRDLQGRVIGWLIRQGTHVARYSASLRFERTVLTAQDDFELLGGAAAVSAETSLLLRNGHGLYRYDPISDRLSANRMPSGALSSAQRMMLTQDASNLYVLSGGQLYQAPQAGDSIANRVATLGATASRIWSTNNQILWIEPSASVNGVTQPARLRGWSKTTGIVVNALTGRVPTSVQAAAGAPADTLAVVATDGERLFVNQINPSLGPIASTVLSDGAGLTTVTGHSWVPGSVKGAFRDWDQANDAHYYRLLLVGPSLRSVDTGSAGVVATLGLAPDGLQSVQSLHTATPVSLDRVLLHTRQLVNGQTLQSVYYADLNVSYTLTRRGP